MSENEIKRYPAILYFKGGLKDVPNEYLYGKVQVGTSSKPLDYQTLCESVDMNKFRELFDVVGILDTVEFVSKEDYEANSSDD